MSDKNEGNSASEAYRLLVTGVNKDKSRVTPDARESLNQAREVYKRLLSRFIGSYSIRNVALIKMSDASTTSKDYSDLVNDPSVRIIKEETHFSIEETRDEREGVTNKTPCYTIAITYHKVEISKAFDRMDKFLDELVETVPPITKSSVLDELINSWAYFVSEVPPAEMKEYYRIEDKLKSVKNIIAARDETLAPAETTEDIIGLPPLSTSDDIPSDNSEIKVKSKPDTILKKKDDPVAEKAFVMDPMAPIDPMAPMETPEGIADDLDEVMEGTKYQTDPDDPIIGTTEPRPTKPLVEPKPAVPKPKPGQKKAPSNTARSRVKSKKEVKK
jgi:hypothetical protein